MNIFKKLFGKKPKPIEIIREGVHFYIRKTEDGGWNLYLDNYKNKTWEEQWWTESYKEHGQFSSYEHAKARWDQFVAYSEPRNQPIEVLERIYR